MTTSNLPSRSPSSCILSKFTAFWVSFSGGLDGGNSDVGVTRLPNSDTFDICGLASNSLRTCLPTAPVAPTMSADNAGYRQKDKYADIWREMRTNWPWRQSL